MFGRTLNASLRLFCRSSAAYEDLRQDGCFGQLPCQRTLQRYKNRVPQFPGSITYILACLD